MAHTLVTIMSAIWKRPAHVLTSQWRCAREHPHDPYIPARTIDDLGLTRVTLHPNEFGDLALMTVTGTFTAPTARKSGAPLALTDIDHFSLHRNGVEIQTLAPNGATISWSDSSPLSGHDVYAVFTVTKDSFVSNPSNEAAVNVETPDPAAAVTDLQASTSA